jgi:hypothetical protein
MANSNDKEPEEVCGVWIAQEGGSNVPNSFLQESS